jgi:NhaA family Na+:H+ antiporter
VIGKPVGILLFCWIAVSRKFCKLPEGLNWKILSGLGAIAGVGFTMSIFISNLAFTGKMDLIEESKIAVLAGSLVAAVAGLFILWVSCKKPSVIISRD